MTDKRQVDGFPRPHWVARKLLAGEAVGMQQTLVELGARLKRAAEGRTLFHVMRLLNNWKDTRTAQEKEWLFDDWADDLEEFSEAHLRTACKAWRQNNSYPPKVADIRALCEQQRLHDIEMQRRTRVLLGMEDPKPWEKPAQHQLENKSRGKTVEVEQRRAGLHAIGDSLAAMKAPPPELPSTARAATDAAELQQHLARKKA